MTISGTESIRDKMFSEALALFKERGYSNVSLQDIVASAGATKGAFYHYWSSKEELLHLIHEQFIAVEIRNAERVIGTSLSPRVKLQQIIVDLLESITVYQAHVTVFFRDWHFLSAENLEQIKTKRDYYERLVTMVIQAGIDAGEFRSDVDPKIAVFALFGMCNWTYTWYKPAGRFDYKEIARQFIAIYLEGMGRPLPHEIATVDEGEESAEARR